MTRGSRDSGSKIFVGAAFGCWCWRSFNSVEFHRRVLFGLRERFMRECENAMMSGMGGNHLRELFFVTARREHSTDDAVIKCQYFVIPGSSGFHGQAIMHFGVPPI